MMPGEVRTLQSPAPPLHYNWVVYSHTRPYSALLGLTGPYCALIGFTLHLSNGLTDGRTNARTLRLIGLLSKPKIRTLPAGDAVRECKNHSLPAGCAPPAGYAAREA